MKKFSILILYVFVSIVTLIITVSGYAAFYPYQDYTYESKVDPGEISIWILVEESEKCRGRYCCAVFKNPDVASKIDFVLACADLMIRAPGGKASLIKYAYYDQGELVIFLITSSVHGVIHYKKVPPIDEGEKQVIEQMLSEFSKRIDSI